MTRFVCFCVLLFASTVLRTQGQDQPPVNLEDLKSPDLQKQRQAARELATLGAMGKRSEAVLLPLAQALTAEDLEVRRSVAYALSSHIIAMKSAPPFELVSFLEAGLKDEDERVRSCCQNAFAQLGKPALPVLLKQLTCKEPPLRIAAAQILARMGTSGQTYPEAIPALVEALGEKDNDLRYAAVGALGCFVEELQDPPKQLVPVLVRALSDPNQKCREGAAWALASLGKPAVPAVLELLQGKDTALQARAARIFGTMGVLGQHYPELEAPLRLAAQSDAAEVRAAALYAVRALGGFRPRQQP
jgi:HEAT repeat protein